MKLQSQSVDGQGEIALSSTLVGSGTPFDLYRDLVEHSQDLLCTHDLSGQLFFLNPLPAQILGYEVGELLRTPMRNLIVPRFRPLFDEYLETIQKHGVAEGYMSVLTRAGEQRIWKYRSTLRTEGVPTPVVRGIAHDITDLKRAEIAIRESNGRLQMLLNINRALVSHLDLRELLPAISVALQSVFQHDFAAVGLYDAGGRSLLFHALNCPTGELQPEVVSIEESSAGFHPPPDDITFFDRCDFDALPGSVAHRLLADDIQTLCCIPLETGRRVIGVIGLQSKQAGAFRGVDLGLMRQVANQIALALDNASAYQEIARLTNRLIEEKIYLENEIEEELHFDDVIGENRALKEVLARAGTVAPSDATVLILGETGTGKELVARAIHRLSGRCKENFIKLNCAAIPTGLLESELFGHERGAFTGAVNQKIGRLELADGGTLFLDEIGEIPLELQPKLLRVLQDHEFERLGSTRTIRVNLRVIAATNRDLARQMAERQFRSDLFYRLNVFPLRLPALRERREDIPALVFHFVQKHAAHMHKEIRSIPKRTLDALMSYDWPGNIRELENLVERSVILTTGTTLEAPTGELGATHEPASSGTLREAEHVHVARVMEETGGNISSAAAKLGLKRTTLQSKLRRLGIDPVDYRRDSGSAD